MTIEGAIEMPKHLIHAGDFRQAEAFARERNWRNAEWVYIRLPENLMGAEGPLRNPASETEFHKVGTYWRHEYSNEIEQEALIRGFE